MFFIINFLIFEMNLVTKRRTKFKSVNAKTFLKFTFYGIGHFYCLKVSGANNEIVPQKAACFFKKNYFCGKKAFQISRI